jgi:predicted peptidase
MKKLNLMKTRLLIVGFFIVSFIDAQQTAQKFIQETQYLLFLPEGYEKDSTQRWPLLLFLHGSGESGVDLEKVKAHGPPKLIEAGKKFPFIVISPQAPPQNGWKAEVLKAMLDDLKKKYRVDNDRVYLTGLSMGGYGTWDLAEKYPDEFAAIAPICGGGDPQRTWKLRHMPVWCFHGAKDNVVPLASSQAMVDEARKYNPDIRFTIYPEANHNSWEITYNNDSLYTWLLAQKKFRYKPVTLQPELLKEYEGYYTNIKRDTLQMVVVNGRLVAKPGHETVELMASSPTDFYWDPNSINEVRFVRDKKGTITGLTILTEEREEAKKILTTQKSK